MQGLKVKGWERQEWLGHTQQRLSREVPERCKMELQGTQQICIVAELLLMARHRAQRQTELQQCSCIIAVVMGGEETPWLPHPAVTEGHGFTVCFLYLPCQ